MQRGAVEEWLLGLGGKTLGITIGWVQSILELGGGGDGCRLV